MVEHPIPVLEFKGSKKVNMWPHTYSNGNILGRTANKNVPLYAYTPPLCLFIAAQMDWKIINIQGLCYKTFDCGSLRRGVEN